MQLHSDHVFWPQIYHEPTVGHCTLDRNIKCDVAIIGGGISGALSAWHLVREGMHVALVDRHPLGLGSTAASTGLLQYEIDTPLIELVDKIGLDRAAAAYRASLQALRAFEPLVAELGDRCGLIPRPSVYLASDAADVPDLQRECDARQSIGIDVRFLNAGALRDTFQLSRCAALLSRQAFEVDPFRLTQRLLGKAIEGGLEAFAHTEIVQHIPTADGAAIVSRQGARIDAKKIIFASGYETIVELPSDLCRLCSTYALVSDPVKNFDAWPGRCLIWESARPYLYMRTTEDDRVMVGGEDVDIVAPKARDCLLPIKTRTLLERFASLFPALPITCASAWAGTFSQTRDGLPYIGQLPQFPHSYFALGYGGNGITFSLLAAQIIRDHLTGRRNDDAELFVFGR